MKTLLRSALLGLLTSLLIVSLSQAQDLTFASSEEAIEHYLDGLSRNNLEQLLEASAAAKMGAGFDFQLQVERLGNVVPLVSIGVPADYALYTELNQLQYSSQLLSQARALTLGLVADLGSGDLFRFELESAAMAAFVTALDPSRLTELEILQIIHPDESLLTNERYLEASGLNAGVYGADAQTERAILLLFEDKYYLLGFTLLRYDTSWLISQQYTPFVDTDPNGMVTELSVDAVDALFDSD